MFAVVNIPGDEKYLVKNVERSPFFVSGHEVQISVYATKREAAKAHPDLRSEVYDTRVYEVTREQAERFEMERVSVEFEPYPLVLARAEHEELVKKAAEHLNGVDLLDEGTSRQAARDWAEKSEVESLDRCWQCIEEECDVLTYQEWVAERHIHVMRYINLKEVE